VFCPFFPRNEVIEALPFLVMTLITTRSAGVLSQHVLRVGGLDYLAHSAYNGCLNSSE
jgi:hypothetical protein